MTPGRRSAFPTPNRAVSRVAEISGAAAAEAPTALGFDGEGAPGTGDARAKPKFVRRAWFVAGTGRRNARRGASGCEERSFYS